MQTIVQRGEGSVTGATIAIVQLLKEEELEAKLTNAKNYNSLNNGGPGHSTNI